MKITADVSSVAQKAIQVFALGSSATLIFVGTMANSPNPIPRGCVRIALDHPKASGTALALIALSPTIFNVTKKTISLVKDGVHAITLPIKKMKEHPYKTLIATSILAAGVLYFNPLDNQQINNLHESVENFRVVGAQAIQKGIAKTSEVLDTGKSTLNSLKEQGAAFKEYYFG